MVACEPAEVEDFGIGLSPAGRGGRRAGGRARRGDRSTSCATGRADARALDRRRDRRDGGAARRRAARSRAFASASAAPPGGPGLARVLLRDRRARVPSARAHGSSIEVVPAVLRCADAGTSGRSRSPPFRCPECAGGDVAVVEGERARGRVDRGRGGAAVHRTKVKVVEDGARRQRHDRDGQPRTTSTAPACAVVNLMSAPGAGKTTLLERGAARPRRRARRRARGRRARAASTPTGSSRLHVPGDPAQHRPGLRRRVPPRRQHGALGAARGCRSTRSTCW